MWSHYADGHNGIRIHFKIDNLGFAKDGDAPKKLIIFKAAKN